MPQQSTGLKPKQRRCLTKSRFKLGMACPSKLFYTGKKDYANLQDDNSFLKALAEGGFQVGGLSQQRFGPAHEVKTLEYEAALAQTAELLSHDKIVIHEGAIQFENLFIRADILIKEGNTIRLIEVKAKSYDPEADGDFRGKKGELASKWKPYLLDVAFQRYVLKKAYPDLKVEAFLLLADKTAECSVDGLNQRFQMVKEENGRFHVEIKDADYLRKSAESLLRLISVDDQCNQLFRDALKETFGPVILEERIKWLADHYERDEKLIAPLSGSCGKCEFRATKEETSDGKRDGFMECWVAGMGWSEKEFEQPNILTLWNYREKTRLINERRGLISQVLESDLKLKTDDRSGISASERQWLQVSCVIDGKEDAWIDRKGLAEEMQEWRFPLHFIDFETTRVAIPFTTGMRPYELVAFQFSHHEVDQNGMVEHRGQYLNATPGEFPNYDFVRALKKEVEDDNGTIFMYAPHENSSLVAIHDQLESDPDAPGDAEELKLLIHSITTAYEGNELRWQGDRTMVDLCNLVKRHYYAPEMNGSNSIKKVLPAMLNQSAFLQSRYGDDLYGRADGIRSLNFKTPMKWVEIVDAKAKDPYKLLPKLFSDISNFDPDTLAEFSGLEDDVREGGAAMTAYSRLQFEELKTSLRKEIESALLRYCELDTLAMVMIYEGWVDALKDPIN